MTLFHKLACILTAILMMGCSSAEFSSNSTNNVFINQITSNPPGAEVIINGHSMGLAPLYNIYLPGDTQQTDIMFKLKNYQDFSITRFVRQNGNQKIVDNIHADLQFEGTGIALSTTVAADIYIDDKLVGHQHIRMPIDAGKHQLKVVAEGHKTFEQDIYVPPNSLTSRWINLVPDGQSLTLYGNHFFDEQTQIFVDKKPIGNFKSTKSSNQSSSTSVQSTQVVVDGVLHETHRTIQESNNPGFSLKVKLDEGKHTLRVVNGKFSFEETINMIEGQHLQLDLSELAMRHGPYIGIFAQAYVNNSNVKGLVISNVVSNSPASVAGLKEKDILTEYDGQAVTNMMELQKVIFKQPPGKTVSLVYVRNGKHIRTSITPVKRSAVNMRISQNIRSHLNDAARMLAELERTRAELQQKSKELRRQLENYAGQDEAAKGLKAAIEAMEKARQNIEQEMKDVKNKMKHSHAEGSKKERKKHIENKRQKGVENERR